MTGYTASEKMLQRVSGVKNAKAGDIVEGKLDFVIAHNEIGSLLGKMFKEANVQKVFDENRTAIFLGHHQFLPQTDDRAEQIAEVRAAAKRIKIGHIFDFGSGVMHWLMPEQGLAYPGAVIGGGDSHTTAYGGIGSYSFAISGEAALLFMTGKTWLKVPETVRINVKGRLKKGSTVRDICQYAIKEVPPSKLAGFTTLEWAGPVIEKLSWQERVVLGAWAYEMGAGASYISPNEEIIQYYRKRAIKKDFVPVFNDPDAVFKAEYELDVTDMGPKVAVPYHPSNTKDVGDVQGVEIQQAYIGGCTGGNIESLRQAAEILKGHRVNPNVRLLIVPGTQEINNTALQEGLHEIFFKAGAMVLPPYCGPCQMFCVGNLAPGSKEENLEPEVMIGTNPRNYPGRAAKGTKVYLASPYTVAASAIEGKITDPREFLGVN